jgi:riboflavin biosynthesis pyrimidine reductase
VEPIVAPAGPVPLELLEAVFEPGPARVLAVMVSSVDGRATLQGRSGELGSDADRSVLAFLRACAQAILVGAGTARTEGYGPAEVRSPVLRALRRRLGIPGDEVPISVVTRNERPIFAARAVALSQHADPEELWRAAGAEPDRPGFLLVEGGPHVLGSLLAARALDELSLTIAPLVVGSLEQALVPTELGAPIELAPVRLLVTPRELIWRLRIERSA